MVGQDHLAQFDRWREPLDILRHAHLLVLARPTSLSTVADPLPSWPEELRQLTFALAKRLGLDATWLPEEQMVQLTPATKDWQGRVYFLSGIVGAISSQELRQELQSKIPTSIVGLPTGVARYILQHGLYGSGSPSTNHQTSR